MSYLRTLEGVESETDELNDLFNTNDVLGCMIYGPNAWNQVKSFACNRALELLANKNGFQANAKKIFGRKNYVVANDILDKTFGFNHRLGCELLGAEDWAEFVGDCKTYEPEELDGFSITKALKSLANPAGALFPSEWTPQGVASFVLAPGLSNAVNAIQIKTDAQKQAEADAARAQAEADAAAAYAQQQAILAAQQVQAAKDTYNTAYANARAQADADAAAQANLKYQLQTNPEYLQSKSNTLLMIGGLTVLAIALWRK